jgi:hypothetical protein
MNGEKRSEYKSLIGKCGGNERRGRSRRRWEYIIEMDFKGFGGHGLDSSGLGQERVVDC